MMLCLVTDRRRLGAAVGAPESAWVDLLVQQVRGAVAGGVDLVQVRERDLDAGPLVAIVRRLIAEAPGAAERIVVNDRLDVAMACGARGVHLRELSFGVDDVRRVAPALAIGASVHDRAGALRRRGATYLLAGTVLPTASKGPGRLLGWEGLSEVVGAARDCAVLGIGGLDLPQVSYLARTGAAGLAAVGAFIPPNQDDVGAFAQNCARNLRLAFDSALRVT